MYKSSPTQAQYLGVKEFPKASTELSFTTIHTLGHIAEQCDWMLQEIGDLSMLSHNNPALPFYPVKCVHSSERKSCDLLKGMNRNMEGDKTSILWGCTTRVKQGGGEE